MECEKLSAKALEIFKKFRPFYPPDPWANPQWKEEGIIIDNGPYDLRKKEERDRLEDVQKKMVGYVMVLEAEKIMKNESTLIGLTAHCIPRSTQRPLEILLILEELDFQIETLDFMES